MVSIGMPSTPSRSAAKGCPFDAPQGGEEPERIFLFFGFLLHSPRFLLLGLQRFRSHWLTIFVLQDVVNDRWQVGRAFSGDLSGKALPEYLYSLIDRGNAQEVSRICTNSEIPPDHQPAGHIF